LQISASHFFVYDINKGMYPDSIGLMRQ